MTPQFSIQLALWIIAALGSAVAVSQYFVFRQKERRLPAACELDDLEIKVTQKRKDLEEAEGELTRAREVIGEATQKQAELNEARRWFHENKLELEKVAGERTQQEALRAQLKILQEEKSAVAGEIERMKSGFRSDLLKLQEEKAGAFEDLQKIQKEKAAESANITNLSTQRANLVAELEHARTELKGLQQAIDDAKLQHNIVQTELKLKSVELKRVEDFLEAAAKSQESVKKKLEELVAKIDAEKRRLVEVETNHHALTQKCDRLKAEIADLEKWKETLQGLLSHLQAAHDRMDPQASTEDRYRDLWQPMEFRLKRGTRNLPEKEALLECESYLKSYGLVYPKRVLLAFHTALKTADMSPLTVLAGISGTGKSLLPMRYAEALGLHMVSLAVQPRWDSPQDLFGFFNHLERRFKATDLARAMVQFELFNRKSWVLPKDWNEGREDRMLLVLLDEMNLARVEYYFSEFLSRLETRREIDENDASLRSKAEIALDMGSLRKDERPIRLYPGRNVLFTGTMNEDESTQTLSDKVVDRACVLRFGRPKQLEQQKGKRGNSPKEEGLSFANWKNWFNPELAEAERKEVEGWIQQLNDGMDAVGKPFAYRVHKAILAYVAQYPRLGSDSQTALRVAFADQIEQRILPKLRGVELEGNDEAFLKLEKVIEVTQDAALIKAFRDGQDSRSGTFLWRGLDRSEG